jgi:phage-related tail protein
MSGLQDLEDIPDGIAESDEKLLKAIAELSVQDDMSKKMDEYTKKLESLDKSEQANIAGIFSQAGKGMSADFAQSIVDGFTDSDTSSNAALLN